MAVYTTVSDEDLEAFLEAYDIGELTSFSGISEGVENTNFLVRTTVGTFILTLYEKRVRPEDLPFFLGLMDHLAAKGLNCPRPVAARDGGTLKELNGRPAAVVSFLEGVWPRRIHPAHCRGVGRIMAEMHVAGADFALSRVNNLSLAGWRPLLVASGMRSNEVYHGLYNLLNTELLWLEEHWPSGLPGGVIHADMFPDNVFFLREEVSGLIDFYFACTDALVYDIAICLNAWCFESDGSFNVTKAALMVGAYRGVRDLDPDEIEALPILARGAALRFLLTRLYDWLNHPEGAFVKPKDPMEYLQRLRFHQRVTSVAGYGIT
jgi:homoserine kinase type II